MKRKDHREDTIVINVTRTLSFTYDSDGSPAHKHQTDREHHVKWFCDGGNYSVVFGEHSPFAHPCYSKKKGQLLSIPVRPDARRNETYKYTVVVEARDNKHLIEDPEVLID